MTKELLSVAEFAEAISVSERNAKKLIAAGTVLSVKIGDRRLVPATAMRAYVEQLVAEAQDKRIA